MSDSTNAIDLAELLAKDKNSESFANAVMSMHRQILGRNEGPFNIDSVSYLAIAIECYYYAQQHMKEKPRFPNREALLAFSVDNIQIGGMVLEFGVFSGHTINLIADKMPNTAVYGFNSFQGLPESWTTGAPAGSFARNSLPVVSKNVELIVGMFDRTIPTFLDEHTENVAFLHVDCDLYSSAQTILSQMRKRIVPGTIILFDEYFNYPDWRRHEFAAFQEFIKFSELRYEYIGLVPSYEQVAVRIL